LPLSKLFVIEPTLVPGDKSTPIVVRVWAELRQALQTHSQSSLIQFTRQPVGNPSWTYECEASQAKSTRLPRLFGVRRLGCHAGLIALPHRFRIGTVSRHVLHFETPRYPGESRLAIGIPRIDSTHLGRLHFESVSRFRHPETVLIPTIR
jgi:hypothetical protein